MKRFKVFIYSATALCTFIVVGFYFWHFHGAFSCQAKDWSDFGTYINGLMMPFLAIINTVILVELTIAISRINENRSKAEVKAQKDLLLIQLRRQAIETFYQVMNQYFDNKYLKEDRGKATSCASEYLKRFLETDFKYFDFDKSDVVRRKICSLQLAIDRVHLDIEMNQSFNKEKYMHALSLKDEIISDLQSNVLAVINNIESASIENDKI
jgi:hypothetical protein